MTHTSNASTPENGRGKRIKSLSSSSARQREFRATLGYKKPCHKRKKSVREGEQKEKIREDSKGEREEKERRKGEGGGANKNKFYPKKLV